MKKEALLNDVYQYLCEQEEEQEFIPGKSVVPVSGSKLTTEDKLALVECSFEGWMTEGKYCEKFSTALKNYIGTRYCCLTNSGSSANLLAVTSCLKLWDKDRKKNKIITCATAFPTTVAPIIQNGAVPLFVDINPRTLAPNWNDLDEAMQDKDVAGMIQAHTLGFPFDEDVIAEMMYKKNLWLIADGCDSLGATIGESKKAGSFADVSTCSFFPAHHLTTGEGGCLFTNNSILKTIIDSFRSWSRDCFCLPGQDNTCGKRFSHKWKNLPDGYDHKYTFTDFGYNLHMTEPEAALGLSQFERIDSIVSSRRKNFEYLLDNLSDFNDTLIFVCYDYGITKSSPFGFPIMVKSDAPFTKQELVAFLESKRVRTRPIFAGNITRQPMFDNVPYEVVSDLSGSDFVMNNGFWIGVCTEITKPMLDYVIEMFHDFKKMKGF